MHVNREREQYIREAMREKLHPASVNPVRLFYSYTKAILNIKTLLTGV